MTANSLSPYSAALAVLGALLAATIAALGLSGTATATTPCGKAVLADWFDNARIDRLYELHCYEEAIDAIPEEIRVYADAEEVISRAFQAASGRRLKSRKLESPISSDPPPKVTPVVNASAPAAIPLPFLVLAGLSFVLLAAGALGYLSRRRRSQTDDFSDEDTPR